MNEEQSTKLDIALRIARCTTPDELTASVTWPETCHFEWARAHPDHHGFNARQAVNHKRLHDAAVDYIEEVLNKQRRRIADLNAKCKHLRMNQTITVDDEVLRGRNAIQRENEELKATNARLLQDVMDLKDVRNQLQADRDRIASKIEKQQDTNSSILQDVIDLKNRKLLEVKELTATISARDRSIEALCAQSNAYRDSVFKLEAENEELRTKLSYRDKDIERLYQNNEELNAIVKYLS